jgi:hypothetical protein
MHANTLSSGELLHASVTARRRTRLLMCTCNIVTVVVAMPWHARMRETTCKHTPING